jgi:hypothetical protein
MHNWKPFLSLLMNIREMTKYNYKPWPPHFISWLQTLSCLSRAAFKTSSLDADEAMVESWHSVALKKRLFSFIF